MGGGGSKIISFIVGQKMIWFLTGWGHCGSPLKSWYLIYSFHTGQWYVKYADCRYEDVHFTLFSMVGLINNKIGGGGGVQWAITQHLLAPEALPINNNNSFVGIIHVFAGKFSQNSQQFLCKDHFPSSNIEFSQFKI